MADYSLCRTTPNHIKYLARPEFSWILAVCMSTTSMAIFSNPLFATCSVYARNTSFVGWLVAVMNMNMIMQFTPVNWSLQIIDTPVMAQVKMATSEKCRSLCGVVHLTEAQTRLFRERIKREYHVHLYVEFSSCVGCHLPNWSVSYHLSVMFLTGLLEFVYYVVVGAVDGWLTE